MKMVVYREISPDDGFILTAYLTCRPCNAYGKLLRTTINTIFYLQRPRDKQEEEPKNASDTTEGRINCGTATSGN